MEAAKRAVRRRHDEDLKVRVLADCAKAGASVASVALAHGLNANLVHKWRRVAGCDTKRQRTPREVFLPVQVEAPPSQPGAPDVRIELRRGATIIALSWPVSAMTECAAWMRELLR